MRQKLQSYTIWCKDHGVIGVGNGHDRSASVSGLIDEQGVWQEAVMLWPYVLILGLWVPS